MNIIIRILLAGVVNQNKTSSLKSKMFALRVLFQLLPCKQENLSRTRFNNNVCYWF